MPEAAFELNTRRLKCRCESQKQARDHGDDRGEQEDPLVDRHFIEPRDVAWNQGDQRLHAGKSQGEADDARAASLHQPLDEHLTHDTPAACAQGGPDTHLLRAGGRARQKERREIGARDEQDEGHCGQEHVEHQTDVAHDLIVQPRDHDTSARISVGIVLLQPPRDRGHLGLRLVQTDACPEASHRAKIQAAAFGRSHNGGQRQGSPNLSPFWKCEISRRHSDNHA